MKLLKMASLAILGLALSMSHAMADNLDQLKPLMKTTKPQGSGPFPAVLMLSGTSGFNIANGSYDTVQVDLTNLGFIVLRVDSIGARGLQNNSGGKVTWNDQISDVQAVARYLRTQVDVKSNAINVLGWSSGGQGALAAAQVGGDITKAIAYYPVCHRLQSGDPKVPTLIMSGEADDVASLPVCQKMFGTAKNVTLRAYPDANHGFDNKNFSPSRKYAFGTLGYNEDAAKRAWAELMGFLAR